MKVLNYRWLPAPSEHIGDLVDFLIRSCMNHLQHTYFHIWFWRAIQIWRNVRWALHRESSRYLYAWNIAFNLSSQFEHNMSGTWKENKRSTPSLNFDDTSKFWGEKYIGSRRFNIYWFFFANDTRVSRKVYKVKACLLRLKCSVNSKYKTQVLSSLDRILFQFLYT